MLVEVAGIIIKNVDGTYLMCHPTLHLDKWALPKGHIEIGETTVEAAIRETKEETNIDIEMLDGNLIYLNHITYRSGKDNKKLHVYIFESNVDVKLLNLDIKCISYYSTKNGNKLPEIDGYRWMNVEEMLKFGMKFMINFINNNIEYFKNK